MGDVVDEVDLFRIPLGIGAAVALGSWSLLLAQQRAHPPHDLEVMRDPAVSLLSR